MSLSFTLLNTLLFLLPGLTYIFSASTSNRNFRKSAPRPSSLAVIAGVPLASTLIYSLAAGFYFVNHEFLKAGEVWIETDSINIFQGLLGTQKGSDLSASQIMTYLLSYSGILIFAFILGKVFSIRSIGWLNRIVKFAEIGDWVLTADVIVDHGIQGSYMYTGALQFARLDEQGNFETVMLDRASRATLSIEYKNDEPVDRKNENLYGPIILNKGEIKSLTVYVVDSEKNLIPLPEPKTPLLMRARKAWEKYRQAKLKKKTEKAEKAAAAREQAAKIEQEAARAANNKAEKTVPAAKPGQAESPTKTKTTRTANKKPTKTEAAKKPKPQTNKPAKKNTKTSKTTAKPKK